MSGFLADEKRYFHYDYEYLYKYIFCYEKDICLISGLLVDMKHNWEDIGHSLFSYPCIANWLQMPIVYIEDEESGSLVYEFLLKQIAKSYDKFYF